MENEAIDKVKRATESIIAETLDYGHLKAAVDELHDHLIQLSKLNMEAEVNSEDLILPSGKAIGPRWAGMCVVDLLRTRQFMRGIYQAVADIATSKLNRPIYIVYAGTGPFATLVLPLLYRFTSDEVKFIFLEANIISINSVRNVFHRLNATDYIAELYHCDAANFDLSELGKKADLLIVECLQHALLKEPQVAITCNLVSQMKEEVVLIPEKIELHAGLLNMKKRGKMLESNQLNEQNDDWFLNIQNIFTLNKSIKDTINGRFNLQEYNFPTALVSFSLEERSAFDTISIQTELTIYNDVYLKINESGLTTPYILANLESNPEITGIQAQYEIGVAPGFKIDFLRSDNS